MKNYLTSKYSPFGRIIHFRGVIILRSVFIFLITSSVQANARGYSQRLSLSHKNAPLAKIFKDIKRQSGYLFIYNDDQLAKATSVTIDVRDASLEVVLNLCFKDQPLTYKIIDKTIVIVPKEPVVAFQRVIATSPWQITGQVTDENNVPLPGVSILLKGTQIGTTTDENGKFLVNVTGGGTLVFTYTGFVNQEITVNNIAVVNVRLVRKDAFLNGVVVVGYGTQLKRDVSGAIQVVTEKEFNKGVVQTAADLLQGKVAGLSITTETGDVTAGPSIHLRGPSSLTGSSSPYVVVDGVPGMDLNSVAPQDIESVSVLKDAAASAIYGSRSASGVILITTKKGKAGQQHLQFNNYMAIETISKKPDLLSAAEWQKYAKDSALDVTGLDAGANTDWFNEITRTGYSDNHNISVTGGSDKGNYRASVNYLNRQGIMRDNELQRYNAFFSVNQKMADGRLNISLVGGLVQSDYTPTNSFNTVLAYTMLPVYNVKNLDGTWFEKYDFEQGNPVHNVAENRNLYKTGLFYGDGNLKIIPFAGFTFGINLFKQRSTQDISRYNAITTQAGRQDHGFALRNNTVWDKSLMEITGEYAKLFGEHSFKLLGGYSYEENFSQFVQASNRGFISDIFEYNNLAVGENLFPTDISSNKDMNKLISFFGRLNYNYKGKYSFTGSLRRDGSSKFGNNNKWGLFPSGSVAWIMSDESFLKRSNVVNDLKFRIGYGVAGNQDGISPYNSIALYGRGDEFYDNGVWRNTYKYAQNDNPDLKWEQTATFNIGFEYALFDRRLYGAIDLYNKKTTDLLYVYNVPVPPNLYPTTLANVGDMTNKGIEINMSYDFVRSANVQWTTTINFAANKNVVDRLSNSVYQTESIKTGSINLRGSGNLTSHIIQEGQEVGTFYGLKSDGLDADGKYIFEDLNKDGNINSLDYTYIGHALPRFTYGITNNITFKKFSIGFFLRGVYGNDVLNNPRLQYANIKWLPGSNVLRDALTNGIRDDPKYSSFYIEKGSFLALDYLNIGYNITPKKFFGVTSLRLYTTIQNLFVITKFKGVDPEVNMSGLAPGIMENTFVPKPRTFSFGLDLNF